MRPLVYARFGLARLSAGAAHAGLEREER